MPKDPSIKKVLVIGGGNVAIDAARVALRCGSDDVTMVCLEPREKMPASVEESAEAEAEGTKITCGYGPKEFIAENGHVTAVVLKKERNFSSGVISRPLFLSFGILVPPVIQIEVPARMPDHACCAARWDWISYRIMPAATDTL